MINEQYIRFDWAAKRMLRDKANFDVLEGLMTVLIGEKVTIDEILESEGNQESETDKYNRVDVMARNSKGEYIIVEVQLTRERYYLERILYGVSKVITDNMRLGDRYEKVKKVYSINIIYFPLGKGKDYLYHGITTFTGVHTNDTLQITDYEANTLKMRTPEQIFPEYFIIRVNEFNQVATTPLEEWIEYLKNGKISSSTKTPGLQEARQKLLYMNMSDKEKATRTMLVRKPLGVRFKPRELTCVVDYRYADGVTRTERSDHTAVVVKAVRRVLDQRRGHRPEQETREHEQHHAARHQQLVERRSVCSLRYGHLVAQAIEVRVANVSGFGLRGFSVGTVFVVSGVFVSHLNHLLSRHFQRFYPPSDGTFLQYKETTAMSILHTFQ